MTDRDDPELDRLLGAALAPPERPADRGFVLRVERGVAEADRYRRWRSGLVRQLVSEALAVGAGAASLGFIAQVPAVREVLDTAPGLAWTGLVALLLLWMLVRGRGQVVV
ncbi:MAG TPA: hypothetical protein VFQ67_10840 [Allosphingosinicella sp.]|jgi:hypothetical protein|nr:hypothetical protein [Allosphingosinicella sp.]